VTAAASRPQRPARPPARRVLAASVVALAGCLLAVLNPSAGVAAPSASTLHASYGAAAHQDFHCWLPTRAAGPLVVVTLHGGGWVGGDALDRISQLNRRLLIADVPSCSVNYRPATEAPWPAQQQDVVLALRAVTARARLWGVGKPEIAVIGESAGGHLALDAASRGSGRRRVCAAVAYSAPTSIALAVQAAGRGTKQAWLVGAAARLAPNPGAANAATIPHDASAADAPALLFASRNEWVPAAHTRRYVAAYAGLAPRVRAVYLTGARHGLEYALEDASVWTRTLSFVRRQCAPRSRTAGDVALEPWVVDGWSPVPSE
jgi:acetyl esterase